MDSKILLLPHSYPWGFFMNGNAHNETRPSIVLNRESIRVLANYDKDQIIEHLFACVHASEVKRSEYKRHQEKDRFVPAHRNVSGLVYFMRSKATGLVKIGCTSNLKKRKQRLDYEQKETLELIQTYESDDMYVYEHWFHECFRSRHVQGEWFRISNKNIGTVNRRVIFDTYKRAQEARRLADAIPF